MTALEFLRHVRPGISELLRDLNVVLPEIECRDGEAWQ
jgi:hypothetical protein